MIAALLITLAIQTGNFQQDHYTSGIVPSAGLIIDIDPDQLFSQGLTRSWNCIDETFEQRQVRSRPLVKVNFTLTPLPSFDGAAILVNPDGATVGETITKKRDTEIHSDSLTKFRIEQHLNLNFNGLFADVANISTNSQQSFKHAKSKNPFASILASTTYKKFPKQVKRKADQFARQQVSKRLDQTLQTFNSTLQQRVFQFQQEYPVLASKDWQLSSDEQNIYLAAGFGDYTHLLKKKRSAIDIALQQDLATQWLNESLAGQSITDQQFQKWSQNSRFTLPHAEASDSKPWSITFLNRATDIKFKDDQLDIRLGFQKFEYEDRILPAIAVRFIYRIKQQSNSWSLVRDGDLQIRGKDSGARHQILRSILRKRLNSILPDEIPVDFPNLNQIPGLADLSLRLESISTQSSVLNCTFEAN